MAEGPLSWVEYEIMPSIKDGCPTAEDFALVNLENNLVEEKCWSDGSGI